MSQSHSDQYVQRPPRIQPTLPEGEIEVPAPPDENANYQPSALELLLPLVMIGGYVVMALSGRGRSLALLIPMGAAMVGSVFVSLRRAIKAQEDLAERKRAYRAQLAGIQEQVEQKHQQQRDFYNWTYPAVAVGLDIARGETFGRIGPRVWERRTNDPDFGKLRLGMSERPSTVQVKLEGGGALAGGADPNLMDEAKRLVRKASVVDGIPAAIQLRKPYGDDRIPADLVPSLGIYTIPPSYDTNATRLHQTTYGFVQALLLHYTAYHSYADTRLIVVGGAASRARWSWAQDLPHTRNGSETYICFEGEEVEYRGQYAARLPLFWKELLKDFQRRQQRASDRESGDITLPFTLVVVDLLSLSEDSSLHDIETVEAVSMLMRQGPELGAAMIFLTEDAARVPADVVGMIELQQQLRDMATFRFARTGVNTTRYNGEADILRDADVQPLAKLLQKHRVRVSAAAALVSAIDLLQMNEMMDERDVSRIDQLRIWQNWEHSRQPDNAGWPRVPIGARAGNEIRELTFEANADGVHGMIAGTTGSGKSELLLTLITGLAVRYDPSVVNFVLVDFKGGAAFEEFRDLPHVVDIVTNLEGNAVERMFAAIKAELDRRGALIARSSVKHIVEYRQRGLHETQEPFPHLFIIIDEFAEMVAENPEYKSQLDSITRLGRAIGVSLVLATQRPAGMITDQMRANMKFKICLRVETTDDSRELLRRADAAYLPPSIPGRAYLQIGNEPPELLQVARAGGPYRVAGQAEIPPVIFAGRQRNRPRRSEDEKPLSRHIVENVIVHAEKPENDVEIQRKPWPNPLPLYLPLNAALNSLEGVDPQYIDPSQHHRLHIRLQADPYPDDQQQTSSAYLNPQLAVWLAAYSSAPLWSQPLSQHKATGAALDALADTVPALEDWRQITEAQEARKQSAEADEREAAYQAGKEALKALLEAVPSLADWAQRSSDFSAHLMRLPHLLRWLYSYTQPADQNGYYNSEQPTTISHYAQTWAVLNPPLAYFIAQYPPLASTLYADDDLLRLLDSRPLLTELLTQDPVLATLVDETGEPGWLDWSWRAEHALQATLGLIDHPRAARQRLVQLSLNRGHIAVFGGSGWGKTTFLRTLIVGLAATHTPSALHIYVMDFGGRNFDAFIGLPHVGGVIRPDEDERINRLLRFLDQEIEERKNRFATLNVDDLLAYNRAETTSRPLPAMLVVIDNFAEIKENMEDLLPTFISLLREGRNYGIYFAASGDAPNTMGGKLFNMFTQRAALRMVDASEYTTIVGRSNLIIPEIAGRGLIAVDRSISPTALEAHFALPLALHPDELIYERRLLQGSDEEQIRLDVDRTLALLSQNATSRLTRGLIQPMRRTWQARGRPNLPRPVERLPNDVYWRELEQSGELPEDKMGFPVLLGIADADLKPMSLSLAKNPHAVVIGPPLSGRTTLLRTWILALARNYSAQEVAFVLIDPQQRLHDYGGEYSLADLPHVLDVIIEEEDAAAFMQRINFEYEFEKRPEDDESAQAVADELLQTAKEVQQQNQTPATNNHSNAADAKTEGTDADAEAKQENKLPETAEPLPVIKRPDIVIFIDNFDDLGDLVPGKRDLNEELGRLVRRHWRDGLHVVLCGSDEVMRSKNDLQRGAWQTRFGIALKSTRGVETLGGRVPRNMRDLELDPGRGFVLEAGRASLFQCANLEPRSTSVGLNEELDRVVESIRIRKPDQYNWYYDSIPEYLRPEPEADEQPTRRDRTRSRSRDTLTRPRGPVDAVAAADTSGTYSSSLTATAEQNKANPLLPLLGGEALRKLTPELLAQLPLNMERLRPQEPQSLPKQRPGQISRFIQAGTIGLPPAERVSDELQQQIEQRIAVYDAIIGPDNALHFKKYSNAMLQACGVQVSQGTLSDMRKLGTTEIRSAVANQQLNLPLALSAEQHDALAERRRVYDALKPARLQQLDDTMLNNLREHGLDQRPLKGVTVQNLQKAIDGGAYAMPDALPTQLLERIEQEVGDTIPAGEVPLPMLSKATPGLLKTLGIEVNGLTQVQLRAAKPDDFASWLQSGALRIPERVPRDTLMVLRRRAMVVDMLKAANLQQLNPPILDALALDGLPDAETLRTMDTADLQAQLDSGQITLPNELPDETMKQVRQALKVRRDLAPDVLRRLPVEFLQTLPLRFSPELQPQHLGHAADEDIAAWIRDGHLLLPDALSQEQSGAIRDALKNKQT